ncbi:RNA-binding protein 25-like, partial [Trifolium medium]|nr:RNA-binding protein 25-like [Trifolium medium]
PEDVNSSDLWPHFAHFGRVGEVYIPAKVDKQGRRFGFVKFREVRDATELLRSISNIWVGSFKLRVNISKFSRRRGSIQKEEAQKEGGGGQREGGGGRLVQGGRSFKVAVSEDVVGGVVEGLSNVPVANRDAAEVVWEVEVEEERLAKLEGAYVGYLVEEKDVVSIQNNLRMDGFHCIKVSAMGYLTILLWSEQANEVKEMVETVGWWCSLFEKVVPWSPELVTNHREAWLRCYGVPIHAWGVDLFRAMAFKFGMF